MSGVFTGALRVEFGDWGPDVGRMARLLGPVEWSCGAVRVVVPAATMTDGASVPRPLWWFLPPWGDEATLPAVLHDYLCEQLDLGRPVAGCETRAACDWQFLEALRARGVRGWRAYAAWLGVRLNSIVQRRV
jgi:hypothetical protein